jgi:hypothetical protein
MLVQRRSQMAAALAHELSYGTASRSSEIARRLT